MMLVLNQLMDEIQGAWRFRWPALVTATVIAFVGWLVVFALPDLYEANARVFVDTSTALKPALEGLAPEQDVNAQLNYVRQSLLQGPQAERIARETGVLPPSVTDPQQRQVLLDRFVGRVDISVDSADGSNDDRKSAGTIYSIVYRDPSRARSLLVVRTVLDTLVNETLGGSKAGSENAQKFLEAQIRDYAKRLSAAEDRLADFKKRNLGLMPSDQGGYFAELQKELDAIRDDETKLQKARTRRAVLESQLHGDAAIAAMGGPEALPGGGPATDINSQIAQAQARLDALRLRFTDKHPDVIAAREALEELKQRRAAEFASLRRGDVGAAAITGASANPVYESIEQQLNQADLDIAELITDQAQHKNKAEEVRRLLGTAPQVEAEYAQLTRDYDVNTTEYKALLQSYEKARLGERADNAGSVRFSVVQPPEADFAPVWPQRSSALALILAAALAVGAALAYALHQSRPVVQSARSLAELTGAKVLGIVGIAFPERAKLGIHRDMRRLALATACLVIAFVAAVALSRAGFRLNGATLHHWLNT